MALPKKYRLKKKKDFEKIFKEGRFFGSSFLVLKASKNTLSFSRFGIVISRKTIKKAVLRNKIKRQISEAIRLKLREIKPGFDVVILPKTSITQKSFQEINQEIEGLLKKAGLFRSL